MKEQMRKALELYLKDYPISATVSDIFEAGYKAALPTNYIDNQTEAFEAWYQKTYVHFGQANFHLNSYGEYVDDDIESSWCAWKAALSAVPAPTMSQFANKADYEAALRSQAQQPAQEPKLNQRLIDTFQELNMGNYGDDDVRQLNDWAIEAYTALAAIKSQPAQESAIKRYTDQSCTQEPAAYLIVSSLSGQVLRESLEFKRMSEVEEKFVRNRYDLTITPLYSSTQEPVKPTEQQILAAAEKAGLWPNTVYTWLPAFHRYHAELAKLNQEPVKQESWISAEERLPDHRNDVLCFVVSNEGETSIKSSHLNPAKTGFYVEYEFDEPIEKVTHWMPLPLAPVKEVTE
jgi:hypothetical protein